MSMQMVLDKIRALESRLALLETMDSVPVVAVAYREANQTINNNTTTVLALNVEGIDTFDAFNTSTFTFTAPYGGYYHIDGGVRWSNDADWTDGDLAQATVRVNTNNTFHIGIAFNYPASNPATMGSGRTLKLDAGDDVDVIVRHLAGAAVDIVGESGGLSTWLSIHRVRGY